MKILQIQGQVEGGGSERHTFLLSKGLRERGHEVVIAVPDNRHPQLQELDDDGFTVERFRLVPSWRRIADVRGGLWVKEVIERHGVELVHSHLFNADAIGLIGARLSGRPIVTTLHGATIGPHLRRGIVLKTFLWMMSQILRRMDHRIAISPFVRDFVATDTGIDARSVEVVFNATDVSYFSREFDSDTIRSDFRLPPKAPIVLCLGVLNPQKRTHVFVEMGIRIADLRPDCHFVLAGDGDLRQALEARVAEAGHANRFHFLGYVRRIRELLSITDVLAFPARDEGFGRSMAEAMSSRVPVVAMDSGACADVVEDGVTGYVVPDGDAEAMLVRCLELLDDAELRKRMGFAGLERARALFDVPRFVESTEASLLRVLEAHRSRS